MSNGHGTWSTFPLRTLLCVSAIGLPFVFGCGSSRKAASDSPSTASTSSDENDPTYQEGYQHAESVLQSAANAPAPQKKEIMQQLQPDQIGKKPRAFWRGVSQAMKDFEVRMANEVRKR